MTDFYVLAHEEARRRAINRIRTAPAGYQVRITEPTRSSDANAKFHAHCGDLEASGLEWGGRTRTLAEWKVLLVSGHASATKQAEVEIVMGLEGELVNLRESTAAMGRSRSSSLIEYTLSFCAMHGVRSSEPEREAA